MKERTTRQLVARADWLTENAGMLLALTVGVTGMAFSVALISRLGFR